MVCCLQALCAGCSRPEACGRSVSPGCGRIRWQTHGDVWGGGVVGGSGGARVASVRWRCLLGGCRGLLLGRCSSPLKGLKKQLVQGTCQALAAPARAPPHPLATMSLSGHHLPQSINRTPTTTVSLCTQCCGARVTDCRAMYVRAKQIHIRAPTPTRAGTFVNSR